MTDNRGHPSDLLAAERTTSIQRYFFLGPDSSTAGGCRTHAYKTGIYYHGFGPIVVVILATYTVPSVHLDSAGNVSTTHAKNRHNRNVCICTDLPKSQISRSQKLVTGKGLCAVRTASMLHSGRYLTYSYTYLSTSRPIVGLRWRNFDILI